MIEQIEFLRDRLSDLSKRNKSLRLLKIYDKWSFDLYNLNELNDGVKHITSQDIVNAIFKGKETIELFTVNTNSDVAESFNKKLGHLYKNLELIEQETGAYDLYIGYPFISGKMSDGTFIQAPVFLFPVRLYKNNKKNLSWQLQLCSKDEGFLNRTLLLAFQKYNNQIIDEQILEEAKEMPKHNFEKWTSELLSTYGIDCYWAKRELVPLHQYKGDEIPNPPNNFIALAPYCILGYFSQGSTSILKDYEELIKLYEENKDLGIIHDIIKSDDLEDLQDQVVDNGTEIKEKDLYSIYEADHSQEKVFGKLINRKGIVVHGPPGTGKSQVIVNLIANSMAEGKKVLVVCQKKAALDVVYQRLEAKELHHNIALVHNQDKDRSFLYKKIYKTLKIQDKKYDTNLEQSLNKINQKIELECKYLKGLYNQLTRERRYGTSVYELYNMVKRPSKDEAFLELGETYNQMTIEELQDTKDVLKTLGDLYLQYGNDHYPLKLRTKFNELEFRKILQLTDKIDELTSMWCSIEKEYGVVLSKTDFNAITQYGDIIEDYRELVLQFNQANFIQRIFLKRKLKEERFLVLEKFFDLPDRKQYNDNYFLNILNNIENITKAKEVISDFIEKINVLSIILDKTPLDAFIKKCQSYNFEPQKLEAIKECLKNDFEDLAYMDETIESLTDNQKAIYQGLQERQFLEVEENLGGFWASTFEHSMLNYWIEECEKVSPALKNVSTKTFEQHRKSLILLIDEKRQVTSKVIRNRMIHALDQLKQNHESIYNEIAFQISKSRKIWTIRRLIHKFGEKGLFDVMPVWLASPETVSSIFPLEQGMFDVVIFDEASQCFTEHGIPALYRGKKLVVAGDEKQLTPFELFRVGISDEDLETMETFEYAQSLLSATKRVFDDTVLSWHYRSKYEELIDFSNEFFYDRMINIAPNRVIDKQEVPFEWRYVGGIWENQTNEIEAKEIIKVIRQCFNNNKELSVGIIAFNKKQQELILETLDETSLKDPDFKQILAHYKNKEKNERIFIKNIENVQGDERDIIIFSIGYAKNTEDKVRSNFGILNNLGGENRLNVAVTRAKTKNIIVTSIEPSDLQVSQSKNRGPRLLKAYLTYVKESIDEFGTDKGGNIPEFISPVQEEVYNALIDKGYKVEVNLGKSHYKVDLAIVDPENKDCYKLAVECDGISYQSSDSVKGREVYRKAFLEVRGWQTYRLWSRNWWKDQQGEMKKLESMLKN